MIIKVYGRNCITSKRISHANQKDLNEGIDDVLNDAVNMGLIEFPKDDDQVNKIWEDASNKVVEYWEKYKQLCCGDYMLIDVDSINDVSIPDMVGSDSSIIFE